MTTSKLPEIRAELVPTEGMRGVGIQHRLFIKLWTIASCDWPRSIYAKRDWSDLDQLLFTPERSEEEKRQLVDLIIRLWALAAEQGRYDEDDWRALRKLIQEPM